MEMQKNPNIQSNLEKEKQSWKNQTPWLQTIPQSYSDQNCMVLAWKQIQVSGTEEKAHSPVVT